jgi:phosphatidylglycerol---prolipoprotein diacylglyceryl transferase
MAVAVLLGVFLTIKEAKKQGIDVDFFLDFFIYGIPGSIIGARLYYVIFSWELYRYNPLKIFAVRQGGLAIHGAVFTGLIILFFLCKKRRVLFGQAVDMMTPALILGQAIGRWGNFINQEAHGGPVSKEFISYFPVFIQKQMYIDGIYYHPAFLYESICNLIIFFLLLFLRRQDYIKKGDLFLVYLISYSLIRFFIEGLRTDSLMLDQLRIARLVSIVVIITASFLFYYRHKNQENT